MNITFEDRFEYTVLTKVHGILNYASLKLIKDELKANAASIISDLSGGINGHLGLVLTPAEYALISPTPYIRYLQPQPLDIMATTTQHNTNHLREHYKEDLCLFREMIALEKALLKLLSHAVPAIYIKSFRNRSSNAINIDIPTILITLF